MRRGTLLTVLLIPVVLVMVGGPIAEPDVLNPGSTQSQEAQVQSLKEVEYVQQEGRPRVLLNSSDAEIVRVEILTDAESGARQRVVKDASTGEIIRTVDLGGAAERKLLCLDASGSIVREKGRPLLVEPFTAYASIPFGAVMSETKNDGYGRLTENHTYIFPCVTEGGGDCFEQTGSEECVFVWPV